MEQGLAKKINVAITAIFLFAFASFVVANSEEKIVFSDSDQDGLSDDEERTYGTDPSKADTDKDGYSDGTEVKSGYDPLKPGPDDRVVANDAVNTSKNTSAEGSVATLSNKFSADLKNFMDSHQDQAVTQDDLKGLVQESLGDQLNLSEESALREIDTSKIKVKKQSYSDLDEDERIEKEIKDWEEYTGTLAGYFTAFVTEKDNPKPSDFDELIMDITEKYEQILSNSPDYDYFRAMAPKVESFLNLATEGQVIEVPQKAFEIHVKLLKIMQAYLDLRDPSTPEIEKDPLSKMLIYAEIKKLENTAKSFIGNDVSNYHNSIYGNQN